jgi:hypothetical protein
MWEMIYMQDNTRINLDAETKSRLKTIVELSGATNQSIIVKIAIDLLFYSLHKTSPDLDMDNITTTVKVPLNEKDYIDFICNIFDEDNLLRKEINRRLNP